MNDEHATLPGESLPGTPYESAFDALFQPGEAANLKVRAKLMRRLSAYVEEEGLSQTDAAERLDTGQPRVSELTSGQIDRFTIDALLNMCAAAGIEVEVRFPKPKA
ncbi:MAG: transcriptional regulator [Bacteroidetes bacterium QH_9_67_14]|nr:MAG: transcriptional regulator [Bacteroidetes bacterium QH_9_67_14]